ncbi:MAG: hypothetical protein RLZZ301_771 [Bacteroidota bacterium]|jgi:hypothetical protein
MRFLAFLCLFLSFSVKAQQTKVFGRVTDNNNIGIGYVTVQYWDSKISTKTDSLGYYSLETYYATDTLIFRSIGYKTQRVKIKKDQVQQLDIRLSTQDKEIGEIIIKAPKETRGAQLHRRVVANKDINNKEKLEAYEYHLYNKIQLDLNNMGEQFLDNGLVKRLDLVMDYMDSSEDGRSFLPVLLSESVSDFYFKNNPKVKKEVVQGTKITGIENMQVTQFLGDMYLDINVYDNVFDLFNKSFISPAATFARNYYNFYLDDSTFIGNDWCYKLRFVPKRTGDLVFEGHMWIHDTTYAVKSISASITKDANLNFIQNLYFEHHFEQVQKEVWMLTEERLIIEFKATEHSKFLGLIGRKYSKRSDFLINKAQNDEFYRKNAVELVDSAKVRDSSYWETQRPQQLNTKEVQIQQMYDSLSVLPFFTNMKKLSYMATTGYWPIQKIEVGSIASAFSMNPVEKYRVAVALRTSNDFSKRLELGGKLAYGFGDDRFKYSLRLRYNITPKKRGMLNAYYSYDIEQIGQSPTAASMGTSFATVFSTAPFDKLTFVNKAGVSLEKDIQKDLILYTAAEWKNYTPLGLANYRKVINLDTVQLSNITTFEWTGRIRWTKDEEFLAGSFDRTTLRSPYPIFSFQTIVGVKNVFGSDYNYQRFEFQYEHNTQLGVFGRMRYGASVGYIHGVTAYPFLKVHEGNQSLWLLTSTFNKLNFLEFISDRYVLGFAENHWEGLFFDRIPLVKKAQLRLVTTERVMLGSLSSKHEAEMLIPDFVKRFNGVPYAEVSVGIENIAKFIRVDLVYRVTHQIPGESPFGIRARYSFNF